jgi:hypothetical protein
MTLKEAIVKCVRDRDGKMACGVVETLMQHGVTTHERCYQYVSKHCEQPLDMSEWDELLYEGDRQISLSL